MDHEQQKAALKEALKEWLDEKFATFGKWTFSTFAIAVVVALGYFILITNGWRAPSG